MQGQTDTPDQPRSLMWTARWLGCGNCFTRPQRPTRTATALPPIATGSRLKWYLTRVAITPIGYAIGTHETPGVDKGSPAQRGAAQPGTVRGDVPCQPVAVRPLCHESHDTPLYSVMSDKVTPARVKNAKGKGGRAVFRLS